LIAKSAAGCADTLCKSVSADVNTKLDVPTGFSPNGDGFNDILFVRGGGIETMSFKVFNRWGELVFETTDITIGWDGTYKGQAQEMDAYAYVLSATFVDGSSQSKSGNVTLIR
jgi:gliding motility-associated-like protein